MPRCCTSLPHHLGLVLEVFLDRLFDFLVVDRKLEPLDVLAMGLSKSAMFDRVCRDLRLRLGQVPVPIDLDCIFVLQTALCLDVADECSPSVNVRRSSLVVWPFVSDPLRVPLCRCQDVVADRT